MNKFRAKLKVLLVGINKYLQPIGSLNGCEYDVVNILRTLKSIYAGQLVIEERILLNENATRENIIYEFKSHFADLREDDIALFYFSGHGSQITAPEEFRHNTSNGMVESLVCFNSPSYKIYEIADKELSVLIWEATKTHNNPFTLIFDCCHSGGLRKNKNVKIRGVKSSNIPRLWQDYYGSEYFHFNDGNVTAPMGRYILLSACRSDQYAQEKYINEKFQGVFTYVLVETLKKCKKPISYQELKSQLEIKVTNEAYSQKPQLRSSLNEDLKCLFLSKNQWFDINNPIVFFNKNDQEGIPIGWVLNLGSIQGVKESGDSNQNEIWLFEEEVFEDNGLLKRKKVAKGILVDVFPNFSTVFIAEELDYRKQYWADITSRNTNKIVLRFDSDIDIDTLDALVVKCGSTSFVDLTAVKGGPSYSINIEDNQLLLKSDNEGFIFYKGMAGTSNLGIRHLFESLQRIANWHNLRELVNPDSSINRGDLKLDFFHVEEPSFNFMEVIKEREIPNILEKSPVLEHTVNIGSQGPIDTKNIEGSLFKLKITNQSQSRLWVSTLYLGSDFRITNRLLPIAMIDPGENQWLEFFESNESKPTKLIPLYIEDAFLDQGIYKIEEHFKIIASTQEFDTSSLNQKSAFQVNNRALGLRRSRLNFTPKDWLVLDFSVELKANVQQSTQVD